jgi:putative FmdB family regulatory protein
MPTYEFRCTDCSAQFEVFQSMSDPDPTTCESCGATGTLEKVLFPVAVHYKGSGFYSTDYSGSKSSAKSTDSSDSGSSSTSTDSSPSSSDSGATSSSGSSSSGDSSS